MLFNVFERKTAALKEKVKGDTVGRAREMAREPAREGRIHVAIRQRDEKEGGPQILNAIRRS